MVILLTLTHWMDANRREAAIRDFKGLIATLLRQSAVCSRRG